MTVPTFSEVHRIQSAARMRDLIRREDLPNDPNWWLAVISIGQAGLAGAESGRADASEWAAVLVESLDAAATRALGIGETIYRRMIACVAAIHYFGERPGDPVRDPELVFRHLAAALGGSPDIYFERWRATLARALEKFGRVRAGEGGDLRAVFAARSWMEGTRAALSTFCLELAPSLADRSRAGESGVDLRDEVARWCAVLAPIEAVRHAAKTARERGERGPGERDADEGEVG